MNAKQENEQIRSAINSLNNLLMGIHGYIGFMESSANSRNQDTTYFGPLRELVERANQVAQTLAHANDGTEFLEDATQPATSPAPFQETTLPGKFHPMESLNGLLQETGVLPAGQPVPADERITQTFFPPGSLAPGQLPRSTVHIAGFSAPPPVPEAPAKARTPSAPPPIPGFEKTAAPAQNDAQRPPEPPQQQTPVRTGILPPQMPADYSNLQPRRTANIVDPRGFAEPASRDMPPAPEVTPPADDLANVEIINREGHRGLVMLVDDEQHLLYVASRILATDGYRVINCEDVFEALHIYENVGTSVDLVILDFSMPTMNGEDAFYELREMNPNAKVILSSGMFERDVISRLLRKGLRAFLPKPYKRESLLQAVTTAITNQ